jgi:hypothetical protein
MALAAPTAPDRMLSGPVRSVLALAWSPDGQRLAEGGDGWPPSSLVLEEWADDH